MNRKCGFPNTIFHPCRQNCYAGLPYCKFHGSQVYLVYFGKSKRNPGIRNAAVFANKKFVRNSDIFDVHGDYLNRWSAPVSKYVPRVNAVVRNSDQADFYAVTAMRDIAKGEEIVFRVPNPLIRFNTRMSPKQKYSPVYSANPPKGILRSGSNPDGRHGESARGENANDIRGSARGANANDIRGALTRIPEVANINKLYDVDWNNKLGEGAFGAVFRARDLKTKRIVALKFMASQNFSPREERKMLNEYNMVRGLESNGRCVPNIICYDKLFKSYVPERNGKNYVLAMKYLKGKDLKEIIEDLRNTSVEIPDEDILDLFIQLFQALAVIHHDNVAHRDIKPGNIIITSAGIPYIVDFGLFCTPNGRKPSTRQPCESRAGTRKYMHPVILREWTSPDEFDSKLWMANDIFGMGVTLWRLYTLKRLSWEDEQYPKKSRCLKLPAHADKRLQRVVQWTTCRTLSRIPSADTILSVLDNPS
jgi:hypothetical protein